ncbi:hypothetical protein RB653_007378 [Dictyostelium firmibasis]|uniref:Peptidyl-prolyl cis-trans isomerase n=1 Tax=Dictyostelium firmibasis TaxID=79012 RepID=A0AAN7TUE2_9MYCE
MSDNINNEIKEDETEPIPPFKCPEWASKPISNVYLEIVKNGVNIDRVDISKDKFTVFGRSSEVASVLLDHPSVSRRHAALVYHGANNRFYLIDLQSATGTQVNNEQIKPLTPTTVKENFTFSFGSSSKQFILKGTVNTNPSSSSSEPKTVTCRHLLVKHQGSRNPSSWRESKIVRTKERAITKLNEYRAMITSGSTSFEDLAHKYSDCSSAKRGGSLDAFKRGQMQRPFEDCAFSLKVGEISGIVDTDSGVHIIERLA